MPNNREELLKSLIEKLTRAFHSMHSEQRFPFGDCLLSKQQVMILFFVYENKGEASVKEVAKFLHVTSGAITQFVDCLVDKKIVKREVNVVDRRSTNIKLTLSTEKKFDNFRKKYLKTASEAFDILNDRELEQFIALVEKIKITKRQ